MHNDDKRPPLEKFLTDRGMPAPQEDPRTTRERERNDALASKGEMVAQWRRFIPTTTPVEDLTNLVYAREAFGLSQGDVAEIVGASPNTIEAAENGKVTIADDALKAFVGGALAAIVKGGENA